MNVFDFIFSFKNKIAYFQHFQDDYMLFLVCLLIPRITLISKCEIVPKFLAELFLGHGVDAHIF